MFLVIFCIYMGLRSFGKEVETLRHLTRNQPAIIDDMAKLRNSATVQGSLKRGKNVIWLSTVTHARQLHPAIQKSSNQTAKLSSAVNRGKELVKEQRIDLEVRRIETRMFQHAWPSRR